MALKRLSVLSRLCLVCLLGFTTSPLAIAATNEDLLEQDERAYVKLINLAYEAWDNAKYSFIVHSSYFPKTVSDRVTTQHDALFTVSTMIEPEPNLMVNTDFYATITNEPQVLRGIFSNLQNSKQQAKFVDFKQLYAMYRLDTYDFSGGKILIQNGVAEISSITDVLNEANIVGYQDPITVGAWQLRADYYNPQNDQLSLILIPLTLRDNTLPKTARFYGDTGGYPSLTGIDPTLLEGISFQPTGFPDSTPKNWSWYGKYTGTRNNVDFFGGLYYGRSPYNVLKIVNRDTSHRVSIVEIRKPTVFSFMGGISHIIENVRLYAENVTQLTVGSADDSFLQLLGGTHIRDAHIAQKIDFEEVSYAVELSYDKQLKKQNDLMYYTSSDAIRKNVNTLSGEMILKKDENQSGFFGLTLNYKDKGRSYFLGARHNYSEAMYVQLSLHNYSGPNTSTLGRWSENRSLQFSMGYDF